MPNITNSAPYLIDTASPRGINTKSMQLVVCLSPRQTRDVEKHSGPYPRPVKQRSTDRGTEPMSDHPEIRIHCRPLDSDSNGFKVTIQQEEYVKLYLAAAYLVCDWSFAASLDHTRIEIRVRHEWQQQALSTCLMMAAINICTIHAKEPCLDPEHSFLLEIYPLSCRAICPIVGCLLYPCLLARIAMMSPTLQALESR
jgi:hypothetical protein